MTTTSTAAATAATATALTTFEILRAAGLGAGALRLGWGRALRAPLFTPDGTLGTPLLALDGTFRSRLASPGGTLGTPLLAFGGTLRSRFASSGGSFRPRFATLALITPVVRTIAPLPGPATAFPRTSRGRSTFTIAAATPGSAATPFVGIREGSASGAPHHPHPVGPRSDAEESARALFEDGDHHFGAGEAQSFQALRHRRIQRPAFENVTLVGHLSPQSCASRPGGKTDSGMPALALQANFESWG